MSRPQLESLEDRLAPAAVRFGVLGDYGFAGTPERDVAALVRAWNPDLILTVGDNNYPDGSASTIDANIGRYYHDYIGNYVGGYGPGSAVNRFFPALGNHDWITRTGSPALPTPYLDYFTLPGNERYYTFTSGPVQFFALDSGDGSGTAADSFDPDGYSSTSIQGQWLESQLAASTATWQVVYLHHAPYSSGGHGNTEVMQWSFRQWGADVVFSGHDHDYERLNVGGLPYFVVGVGGRALNPFATVAAGSELRYNADYGAMRVDADDTSIQFQFFSRAGTLIDSYTLNETTPLPTLAIVATDASAAEWGANAGTLTVSRNGDTSASLTLSYAIAGSASNGSDYGTLSGSVTIAAGATSATITISPKLQEAIEGNETVTLTLAPSAAYNTGAQGTATVVIADAPPALRRFVLSLYRDVLGRSPPPEQQVHVDGWVALAQSQGVTAVVRGFVNSAEYRVRVIRGLYQTYLGRALDPAGQVVWLGVFNATGSSLAVTRGLVLSTEYYQRNNSNVDHLFADLYLDTLGRAIDPAGRQMIQNGLANGTSVASLVEVIQFSRENYGRKVQDIFRTYLGRTADASGEEAWVSLITKGTTLEGVLVLILADPGREYFTRVTN